MLSLAACGDLPRPFQGQPGATAMRLAQPPPARLAVPAPGDALLPDAASRQFADAVAEGLQAQEVPAVASDPRKGDWRLLVTAEAHAGAVIPVFTVENPKGEPQGKAEGKPVPVEAWAAAEPGDPQADRDRRGTGDRRPAHPHRGGAPARRPQQPAQPPRPRAGGRCRGRARRRQPGAHQADARQAEQARPGGAGHRERRRFHPRGPCPHGAGGGSTCSASRSSGC